MQIVAPPKTRSRRSRRDRSSSRGVALIFVLTTIAILTAVGVDFAYQSRVNFELAVQSRDSLRAHALAESGMNMARFLLNLQGQLDGAMAQMGSSAMGGAAMQMVTALLPPVNPIPLEEECGLTHVVTPQNCLAALSVPAIAPGGSAGVAGVAGAAGASGAVAAPAGGAPMGGSGISIRLWKISEKLDSNTIFNFINSFPTPQDKKVKAPTGAPDSTSKAIPVEANFGEFTGTFSIKITDEDQKINVDRLCGTTAGKSLLPLMTTLQMKGLFDNPKWDFIFDEEDHNRDKVSRQDTLLSLCNWVDAGQVGYSYDPTFATGSPFVPGAGDKNGPYSRYKPRYKAKDSHFDSVDELRMIHGISDNFMLAFADKLTVYSAINGKMNPNTDSPDQLFADIASVADNLMDPVLLANPAVLTDIMRQEIQLRTHYPYIQFLGISAGEFLAMVQQNGIRLNPKILDPKNNFFGSTSSTFKVVTTGFAGRVKKTLTAMVQYDPGMGQLLYWHEE